MCKYVETEPFLALDGENIGGLTGDESRPDMRARGVWRHKQNAFFDIQVTYVNSDSQHNLTAEKVYTKHEAASEELQPTDHAGRTRHLHPTHLLS